MPETHPILQLLNQLEGAVDMPALEDRVNERFGSPKIGDNYDPLDAMAAEEAHAASKAAFLDGARERLAGLKQLIPDLRAELEGGEAQLSEGQLRTLANGVYAAGVIMGDHILVAVGTQLLTIVNGGPLVTLEVAHEIEEQL